MASNMIGQQLGSFLIKSQLGAGAMGVVFLATHTRSGRTAALKVITAEHSARGGATERFEREAEILKNLRHPNIVRWLGVGRFRGTNYFAMEYIEGRTLEELLDERLQKSQEPLDWQEVVELGIQISEALHYAHERNVVHRDLKPSNIMITKQDQQVKLTDFGIAKLLDDDATQLTATGRTLGTAAYMAPEQIRGTPEVSHKTDLYALGCLFYQMLTGETPFEGSQLAVLMNSHLTKDPPRPSTKSADLPLELDRLIVQMMAKEPRERPLDAQAVAHRLQEIQAKLRDGEPIRMVFGGEFRSQDVTAPTLDAPVHPSRLGFTESPPDEAIALRSDPSVRARGASKVRRRRKKTTESSWSAPSAGTIGLFLALVFLIGLTIFLLQPPTAEKLYERALPLMESEQAADWKDADRRYLTELDRRYPDHPYQDEVHELRDRIALNDARARARRITRGLLDPRNDVESLYKRMEINASEAERAGNDDVALKTWGDLAQALKTEFPDERGWRLLALENAKNVRETVERRVEEIRTLIAQIQVAESNGQDELALRLHQRLADELHKDPYLGRLIPHHLLPNDLAANPNSSDSDEALAPVGDPEPEIAEETEEP